jgi:ubiquitin-activating enzyme E1
MESKDKEIDTNLYSRQIGTFGMEMMGKLIKMNVMIQGLRGLGVETAKNLILAGPKSVDLYDPTLVTRDDLGSNFYCLEEHVGKISRAEACMVKLKELNPYVTVNIVSSNDHETLNKYHCVVITEQVADIEKLIQMNEHCRSKNIGFILTQSLGAYGMAFVDFGKDFKCNDNNGEEPKTFNVVSITQDKEAICTVHEDKRHTFGDGDYVRFIEVEGMDQINETEPIKITTIDGFSFKLHFDSTNFSAYKANGLVTNVKVPHPMPFKSLKEALDDPNGCHPDGMMINADLSKFGRASQLHLGYVAVQKFFQ